MNGLALLHTPLSDPAENLALEEALLQSRKHGHADGAALFVHVDEPSVVVGLDQDLDHEVDVQLARDEGICVLRRKTGGGAVYRDEGCVTYSFVVAEDDHDAALALVESALVSLGAPVRLAGRNDLYWDERKVSGYAALVDAEHAIVHGTLLFASDIDLMQRLLGRGKDKYRGTPLASVHSRVANLQPLFPDVDTRGFAAMFEDAVAEAARRCGAAVSREPVAQDALRYARLHAGEYSA